MNCFHPVRHQLHYKAYLKPSGVLTKPLQVKFSPNSEFPKQLERVHFYNSVVCPDQASLINIRIIHLSPLAPPVGGSECYSEWGNFTLIILVCVCVCVYKPYYPNSGRFRRKLCRSCFFKDFLYLLQFTIIQSQVNHVTCESDTNRLTWFNNLKVLTLLFYFHGVVNSCSKQLPLILRNIIEMLSWYLEVD